MKPQLQLLLLLLLFSTLSNSIVTAQITTPSIKASFGVEADLRSNYFNGLPQAGNDDWFSRVTGGPITVGVGVGVIDTIGAAYVRKRYTTDPAFRMTPMFRGMQYPQFSVVNGNLLIDAVFIRDHHGDDSTVFSNGNKNAQDPSGWTTASSQSVPNKNDILDIFMHVRRQGTSLSDSVWMFGGVSIDGTTGNRYFDFEMYQTDIYYNRPTLSFAGQGLNAGHTAWEFDATGKVTKPGDVIFTAEYGTAGLNMLEPRIWVHQNTLSITPQAFNWGGDFDGAGAGATFGYANIVPKAAGAFYTGLQCGNNTWAGPFGVVLSNNSVATDYVDKQFMEFSVNLTKLGLDPLAATNDPCKLPFRRILVKSRASTSFSAELKDFVGPFSFFRAPMADASADIPFFCGVAGVSTINVNNPLSTSIYTWRTPNGNIVGDTIGPQITVNMPGTYIVSQELLDSCGTTYARDTVTVTLDPFCTVLKAQVLNLSGAMKGNNALLHWQLNNNESVRWLELERSTGNNAFEIVNKIENNGNAGSTAYAYTDAGAPFGDNSTIFYRVKLIDNNGNTTYSNIIGISSEAIAQPSVTLMGNPVKTQPQLVIKTIQTGETRIVVTDHSGKIVHRENKMLQKGTNVVTLSGDGYNKAGVYIIQVETGNARFAQKMVKMH